MESIVSEPTFIRFKYEFFELSHLQPSAAIRDFVVLDSGVGRTVRAHEVSLDRYVYGNPEEHYTHEFRNHID